jgi:chromosome segregation ATPase
MEIEQLQAALRDVQADNAKLSGDIKVRDENIAKLTGELTAARSASEKLGGEVSTLQGRVRVFETEKSELATKLSAAEGSVVKLTNEQRERAVLDELEVMAKGHGLDRQTLRRQFIGLADEGKVERHPEDAKKVATAAFELFKTSKLLGNGSGNGGGSPPKNSNGDQQQRTHIL